MPLMSMVGSIEGNGCLNSVPGVLLSWAAAEQAAHVGIGGVCLDPVELPQSIYVISRDKIPD